MIPESHTDLLTEPIHGVLTTIMPDGQPQSSMVWVDYDGTHLLVNTTRERQKGRNMQANPKVNVFVMDGHNSNRWLSIRGDVVAMVEESAEDHADYLTEWYSGGRKLHYGDIYPSETRIIVKILPVKISVDAHFTGA